MQISSPFLREVGYGFRYNVALRSRVSQLSLEPGHLCIVGPQLPAPGKRLLCIALESLDPPAQQVHMDPQIPCCLALRNSAHSD